ncbi:hypothetical protein AAU57_07035 [Nonlabens sp. YIK11]|uniref:DUF6498-containing protein n=1 Tax=Nonlabens sp. YIK11 TaxID=1453349 RepID=UPI0006DC8A5C|nr:DUF6498-containing protein [Nonlabens sp. YIK11]KQC33097.1 hypothetical protein AAU57_07035 [Nonlabens sp. YIK11]
MKLGVLQPLLKINERTTHIYLSSLFVLLLYFLGSVNAITVIFSYFLETIVIGVINVFKILLSRKKDEKELNGKFFLAAFFTVHYGMFVAIQSMFAFTYLEISDPNWTSSGFELVDNYARVLAMDNIGWILGTIILNNLWVFYKNYLQNGRYLEVSGLELMFAPYVRIFVQQFVVILSGFFISFGAQHAAVVLLIGLRTFIDVMIVEIRDGTPFMEYLVKKNNTNKISDEEFRKYVKNLSE